MNMNIVRGMWDHYRTVHGVTLRAIEAIPADKLDAHPIAGMRTPRELVIHTYVYGAAIPEAVVKGSLTAEDGKEPTDTVKTKDDLLKYARDCFARGDKAVSRMTDADLSKMIPTFWGPTMPGFAMMGVVGDEHLHHRGQLYTYLRAFGVEPPFMWGFDQNEPALQPKQHA